MKYTEARKLQEAYAKCNGLNCAMVVCTRFDLGNNTNPSFLITGASLGTVLNFERI